MFKKGLILFVISFVLVFVSCQSNMQNQDEAKYKAAYVEVNRIYDGGNIDDLDNYIAEDAVDHQMDTMMTTKTGLEGVKESFQKYHEIFPDMKTTIHSMAVSGDTLFAYFTSTGTTAQPFMGMPANQQMTYNGVDMLRFEDGKMVEHWGFADPNEMMEMMQMAQQQQMMDGKKRK